MEQQLISIIVAAYNVEKYLDKCVESLINQTYSHLEIILVDDGSTDRTPSICDNWSRRDCRVQVIHKRNGGLSDARNVGIKRATGRWLGFVDGDDYVLPEMYERLYRSRLEKGITVCGFISEKNNDKQLYPAIEEKLNPSEAINLYLMNELNGHYRGRFTYWGSYAWNKLYDRHLFKSISYPVGKKYEDMYIIFDLIHQSDAIQFISYCGYVYVQHVNSITHENDTIVHESLKARQWQKEQLWKYWNIVDSRMEQLIDCEYFLILYRYACQSVKKRKHNRVIADRAWERLKKSEVRCFPKMMKQKLILFVYFPSIVRFFKKLKSRFEGKLINHG